MTKRMRDREGMLL